MAVKGCLAHGQQQYSNRLWHSSNDSMVLTGQTCAKNTFPTPSHHRHQPEGRMRPRNHAIGTKFWPFLMPEQKPRFIRPAYVFSSLHLSSFGEPVPTGVSAFCSWLTEVKPDVVFCCCSPSAHMFCFLRCFSNQQNVQSGYLSYRRLSVSSNQSGYSPLTSLTNKTFPSADLLLSLDVFFCFSHHSKL